jgi:hypothetical protein
MLQQEFKVGKKARWKIRELKKQEMVTLIELLEQGWKGLFEIVRVEDGIRLLSRQVTIQNKDGEVITLSDFWLEPVNT